MSATGAAYLLLEVGGSLFGLDLSLVEAVIPYRRPDAVPFQRREVVGGLLHRGRFMGVTDLGLLLGLAPTTDDGRAVIVVTGGAEAYAGLVASASHGLLRAADIEEEAKVLGKWEGPFLLYSVKFGDRVAHMLDARSLLEEMSGKAGRSI